MKNLARNILIVFLTLASLALLWQFRSALILVLLSILFAAAARPIVGQLVGGGMNRSIALLMVYIVFVALLVGLFTAAGPSLLGEMENLSDRFIQVYRQVWEEWPNGSQLQQTIVNQLPDPQQLFNVTSSTGSNRILGGVLGFGSGLFGAVGQIFVALVLSIYWTADQVRFERLWLSLLPAETRTRARMIWRDVETGIGQYIRSELLQSLLAGVLLAIGYRLLDVPYATLLAVVGAIAWLIPFLGTFGTFLLAIGVAAPVSLGLAAVTGVYTLVVLLALEIVVEQRLLGRQHYSPLLMLLMIIGFGGVLGVIGIVIAPPVAASLQLIVRHLSMKTEPALTSETIRQIVGLEKNLRALQGQLDGEKTPQQMQVVSILERLDSLIDRARELVEEEQESGNLPRSSEPAGSP